MSSQLAKRVLQTLAYTDQFSYPLSLTEVWLRLIGIPATQAEVRVALRQLEACQWVRAQASLWMVEHGTAQRAYTPALRGVWRRKQPEIARFVNWAERLPWISGVVVTGAVAMDYAPANDDLDFLIITQPGRLWLTRLCVIFFAWRLGTWRTWRETPPNAWCFNLWLDTDHLQLDPKRWSVYSAYEVMQAEWVFSRGRVQQQFYEKNAWVGNILPQFYKKRLRAAKYSVRVRPVHSLFYLISKPVRGLASLVLALVNGGAFVLQYLYMLPHMTRERVGLGFAFFHPRDTSGLIKQHWAQSVWQAIGGMAGRGQQKVVFEPAASRVMLPVELRACVDQAHATAQKLVLVTGVFDGVHREHHLFLEKAAALGDLLLVGVESNVRVRQMKGEGRPRLDEQLRAQAVDSLAVVTRAFVLPDAFTTPAAHRALIAALQPDILAVSSHTKHLAQKQAIMAQFGGEVVVVHRHNPEISSTQLWEQYDETIKLPDAAGT